MPALTEHTPPNDVNIIISPRRVSRLSLPFFRCMSVGVATLTLIGVFLTGHAIRTDASDPCVSLILSVTPEMTEEACLVFDEEGVKAVEGRECPNECDLKYYNSHVDAGKVVAQQRARSLSIGGDFFAFISHQFDPFKILNCRDINNWNCAVTCKLSPGGYCLVDDVDNYEKAKPICEFGTATYNNGKYKCPPIPPPSAPPPPPSVTKTACLSYDNTRKDDFDKTVKGAPCTGITRIGGEITSQYNNECTCEVGTYFFAEIDGSGDLKIDSSGQMIFIPESNPCLSDNSCPHVDVIGQTICVTTNDLTCQ